MIFDPQNGRAGCREPKKQKEKVASNTRFDISCQKTTQNFQCDFVKTETQIEKRKASPTPLA